MIDTYFACCQITWLCHRCYCYRRVYVHCQKTQIHTLHGLLAVDAGCLLCVLLCYSICLHTAHTYVIREEKHLAQSPHPMPCSFFVHFFSFVVFFVAFSHFSTLLYVFLLISFKTQERIRHMLGKNKRKLLWNMSNERIDTCVRILLFIYSHAQLLLALFLAVPFCFDAIHLLR